MSLRRRLDGVATIAISQSEQTARVELAAGASTSAPAHFRTALEESGLELVQMQVHACGAIERHESVRSLVLQSDRWTLQDAEALAPAPLVCVAGAFDDRTVPPTLRVTSVTSPAQ